MARISTQTKPKAKLPKTASGSTARSESLPEESFWVNHGPVCRTVDDLREALRTMTDEQYAYHTARDGNDFARWLTESLHHRHCAQKLERARTRAGALRALSSCGD